MEASITLALRNLQKSVTCSICLEYFSSPVTVLCGHSFCNACMDQALLHNSRCPICSSKIRKRTNELNYELQPLITKIANFVESCQSYQKHKNSEVTATLDERGDKSPTEAPVPVPDKCTSISVPEPEHDETVAAPSAVVPTTSICSSLQCPPESAVYAVGSLVNVTPRLWIGINKPGGTGRVVSVAQTTDNGAATALYTVKYVLDGRTETDINEVFVEPYCEPDRSSRKSKASSEQIVDPVSTGSVVTSMSTNSERPEAEGSAHKKHKSYSEIGSKSVDTGEGYWSSETAGSSSGTRRCAPDAAVATSPASNIRNNRTSPIVLLSTSLDPELQSKLQQLADQCPGVAVSNSFSSAVTHLVVSTDKDRTMKQRTMKYMQALISGIWIVSVEWVIDSMDKHCIQAEATYEVRKNAKATEHFAPHRARLAAAYLAEQAQAGTVVKSPSSSNQPTSRLFGDYIVLLYGQFPTPGPPRSDIHYLLVRGGATVCASVKDFLREATAGKQQNTHRRKVVICSAKQYSDEFCSVTPSTVLTNEAYKHMAMAELCAQEEIITLSHAWVLDSTVNYKILPLNYPLT